MEGKMLEELKYYLEQTAIIASKLRDANINAPLMDDIVENVEDNMKSLVYGVL